MPVQVEDPAAEEQLLWLMAVLQQLGRVRGQGSQCEGSPVETWLRQEGAVTVVQGHLISLLHLGRQRTGLKCVALEATGSLGPLPKAGLIAACTFASLHLPAAAGPGPR